jgi:hypothetical protein
VSSVLNRNPEDISDNLSVGMIVKLAQSMYTASLCFGRFSNTFQFFCWSLPSVMSEEIKCHSFLAIVVLDVLTQHIDDDFKVQPYLRQSFSLCFL